jgi:hypothetical protein
MSFNKAAFLIHSTGLRTWVAAATQIEFIARDDENVAKIDKKYLHDHSDNDLLLISPVAYVWQNNREDNVVSKIHRFDLARGNDDQHIELFETGAIKAIKSKHGDSVWVLKEDKLHSWSVNDGWQDKSLNLGDKKINCFALSSTSSNDVFIAVGQEIYQLNSADNKWEKTLCSTPSDIIDFDCTSADIQSIRAITECHGIVRFNDTKDPEYILAFEEHIRKKSNFIKHFDGNADRFALIPKQLTTGIYYWEPKTGLTEHIKVRAIDENIDQDPLFGKQFDIAGPNGEWIFWADFNELHLYQHNYLDRVKQNK